MRETYNPQEIESLVQKEWRDKDVYRAREHAVGPDGKEKPKFYVCSMLPYPCLLYTSPSPRDAHESRMPSSA